MPDRVFSKEQVATALRYSHDSTSRAFVLSAVAAAYGFDFYSTIHARERLMDEAYECLTAGTEEGIAEELGDVMFIAINIARLIGRKPDELLEEANQKFAARMEKAELFLREVGRDPKTLDETEWRIIWKAAKAWVKQDVDSPATEVVTCRQAPPEARALAREVKPRPENSNPDAIWDPSAGVWRYPGSSDLRDAPTGWKSG